MNVDVVEVVDASVKEAEAEDELTIPIHYLVYMVMELLLMKLRYIIKFNIIFPRSTNCNSITQKCVWLDQWVYPA